MLRLILIIVLVAVIFLGFKFNLVDIDGGHSEIEWLGYRLHMPALLLASIPFVLFFVGFACGQMFSWLQRLSWNKAGRRYLDSHQTTGDTLLRQYVAEKLELPLPKLKPKEQSKVQQPPAPQGVLYQLQKLENNDANSAMWEKWLEHETVGPLASLRLAARLAIRGDGEASQELLKPLTEKTKQYPPIRAAIELYFTNQLSASQWSDALVFLQKHKQDFIEHHYMAFAILLAQQIDDPKIYNKIGKEVGVHPDLLEAHGPHLSERQAVKLAEKAAIYEENNPDLTSKIRGKIKAYREAYLSA